MATGDETTEESFEPFPRQDSLWQSFEDNCLSILNLHEEPRYALRKQRNAPQKMLDPEMGYNLDTSSSNLDHSNTNQPDTHTPLQHLPINKHNTGKPSDDPTSEVQKPFDDMNSITKEATSFVDDQSTVNDKQPAEVDDQPSSTPIALNKQTSNDQNLSVLSDAASDCESETSATSDDDTQSDNEEAEQLDVKNYQQAMNPYFKDGAPLCTLDSNNNLIVTLDDLAKIHSDAIKPGRAIWSDLQKSKMKIKYLPKQSTIDEFLQSIIQAADAEFLMPISKQQLIQNQKLSLWFGDII